MFTASIVLSEDVSSARAQELQNDINNESSAVSPVTVQNNTSNQIPQTSQVQDVTPSLLSSNGTSVELNANSKIFVPQHLKYLNEDVQYMIDIIKIVLKYNGKLFTNLSYYILVNGLHDGIKTFLRDDHTAILCSIPVYLQTIFERDIHHCVMEKKNYNEENCTTYSICTPYGRLIKLVLKDSVFDVQPACLTTLDLLSYSRDGIRLNECAPATILCTPAPFMMIMNQICKSEYTWIHELTEKLERTVMGVNILHDHWKRLIKLGLYNDERVWTFPEQEALKKHLTEEVYSCAICLEKSDNEKEVIEPIESAKKSTGKACKCCQPCKLFLKLPCQHIFHLDCFAKVTLSKSTLTVNCPLCRKSYYVSEL